MNLWLWEAICNRKYEDEALASGLAAVSGSALGVGSPAAVESSISPTVYDPTFEGVQCYRGNVLMPGVNTPTSAISSTAEEAAPNTSYEYCPTGTDPRMWSVELDETARRQVEIADNFRARGVDFEADYGAADRDDEHEQPEADRGDTGTAPGVSAAAIADGSVGDSGDTGTAPGVSAAADADANIGTEATEEMAAIEDIRAENENEESRRTIRRKLRNATRAAAYQILKMVIEP